MTSKSPKWANRLSSDFFLSFLRHNSTKTAEAITTIKTQANNINDWVFHSLLIVIVELELFFC